MRPQRYRLFIIAGLLCSASSHAQISPDLQPPQDIENHAQIMALQRAGLPYLALTAARKNPTMVSDAEMRDLEADYAAELTRLASVTTRMESERFRVADRALAEYDRLIPEWEALGPPAARQLQRIRIDRLQALKARYHMAVIVREYEALKKEGVVLPAYALGNVATAYLYLRQPERASELYQRALEGGSTSKQSDVDRLDDQIGLFYSLVDSEQHDRAKEVIDATVEEQPIWRWIKGLPQRQPNDLRLDAEHTAALQPLYADDTVQAQKLLTDLVETAPNNSNLRTSLAAVYRARQWPRKAREELKIAETLSPRAIVVEAEQAQVAMDLGHWENADALMTDLRERAPEHTLTKKVMREWQRNTKAELQVSAQSGIVSDTPVSGKNDLSIETVLYSAPLNYNWRPFAGVGYAQGKFEEGKSDFRWARAGVQWRGKGLTAELEASSQKYGHGTKAGARVSAAYDLNDHWQIGGAAAWRSTDTPLRALLNNITTNNINAFARWRAHERREWSVNVTGTRFTDGNKRISMNVAGRERLYTSPHFKVDAELGMYASRNSQRGGPYFNPRSDAEVLPAINMTHILYRRYDKMLQHSLRIGAGIYHQRDYGSGGVGMIAYSMRYQHNNNFDIGASLVGVNRPYDGKHERDLRVLLDMNIRF